jgi:hypothetical protein
LRRPTDKIHDQKQCSRQRDPCFHSTTTLANQACFVRQNTSILSRKN